MGILCCLRLWAVAATVSDCGTNIAWPFDELFQKSVDITKNWTTCFKRHQKKPYRGHDERNRPSNEEK